jgi:NADH:ubiquinone oxidoreductase subunit F (NADH-binding)
MVELCRFLATFLESESCGKCIPCREGTHRIRETLDAVLAGFDEPGEHDPLWRFRSVMKLQELGDVMRETSMCNLGRHGADVLLASLKSFRDEFETHVFHKRCLAETSGSQGGHP